MLGWMPSVGSSSSSSVGRRHQRPGDGELLLLAAAEGARQAPLHVLQHREQGVGLVQAVLAGALRRRRGYPFQAHEQVLAAP